MAEFKATLTSLNLVTRDMDATAAFYRTLGVDIPEALLWRTPTGAHHADLTLPNGFGLDFDSEALASQYNAGWTRDSSPRSIIGFSVATREAVDACYAALTAAGHKGLQPPYDAFWGARYAVAEDPDGNHVGIMSPIDEGRKGPPPQV